MAKASSWLTVVKRAFGSPTKDSTERKSCRKRDENCPHEQDDHEDYHKKREKRRWLFRKATDHHVQQISEQKIGAKAKSDADRIEMKDILSSPVPAVEIVRLTARPNNIFKEYYYAAIVIQTAFRGYLARRALRALKGLVKLQALVRGQSVRKQAKLTLKCMQALVRVQDKVRQQRARLSLESRRKSVLAETSTLWDCSSYLHDIRDRVSNSREMSSGVVDDWDDCPQTSEEIEAKLQVKKEATLRRERALAYAFSNQVRRDRRSPSVGNEEEIEEGTKWLDRWMATKPWESDFTNTPSAERRDHNIRTLQVDTFGPNSSYCSARGPYQAQKAQLVGSYSAPNFPSSPLHNTQQKLYSHATPSPSKQKALKVLSTSPRCYKDERCYSATHTPSMARYRLGSSGLAVPNYTAATESTKARARPNSMPRQRPSTPERDQLGRGQSGSARKRLSYNAMVKTKNGNIGVGFGYSNLGQHLRSPSFKSLHNGYVYGIESLSSCYDESTFVRDVSPYSTTDLRWLK